MQDCTDIQAGVCWDCSSAKSGPCLRFGELANTYHPIGFERVDTGLQVLPTGRVQRRRFCFREFVWCDISCFVEKREWAVVQHEVIGKKIFGAWKTVRKKSPQTLA